MADWKSAVDPKTGRTYYYNVKTRETQWRKPMALASSAEKAEMEAKERKQKEFFASMEQNILNSMATGSVPPVKQMTARQREASLRLSGNSARPGLIRTISSMEDTVLKDLVKRVPSHRKLQGSFSSSGRAYGKRNVLDKITESSKEFENSRDLDFEESSIGFGLTAEESKALEHFAEISEDLGKLQEEPENNGNESASNLEDSTGAVEFTANDWKHAMEEEGGEEDLRESLGEEKPTTYKRRNTCGTIYIGSTMAAPDKDATIKCVCGVYRAHVIASFQDEAEEPYDFTKDKYREFNDREAQRKSVGAIAEEDNEVAIEELNLDNEEKDIPTLEEITNFFRDVFRRAQLESDCMIMSLIYVERLIKSTRGLLRPRKSNWRSLLFSCLILASKVWDDLSMWNADFSQTCPAGVHFSLQRINELEVAVLNALKFKVKVPAGEYAKYYFLLRSMVIKSGLGGDDMQTPLDVEGAKELEQVSSGFEAMVSTKRRIAKENALRSKSMGDAEKQKMLAGAQRAAAQQGNAKLEHMVKM